VASIVLHTRRTARDDEFASATGQVGDVARQGGGVALALDRKRTDQMEEASRMREADRRGPELQK
jgi:hypothetical protein